VGPFEIESALLKHPAIAESAAVSKPDPTYGEVVKAVIVLRPGQAGSDELKLAIMNFVRKQLSPWPCRMRSNSWTDFPRPAVARSCAEFFAPKPGGSQWVTCRRSMTRKATCPTINSLRIPFLDYISREYADSLLGTTIGPDSPATFFRAHRFGCRWSR